MGNFDVSAGESGWLQHVLQLKQEVLNSSSADVEQGFKHEALTHPYQKTSSVVPLICAYWQINCLGSCISPASELFLPHCFSGMMEMSTCALQNTNKCLTDRTTNQYFIPNWLWLIGEACLQLETNEMTNMSRKVLSL